MSATFNWAYRPGVTNKYGFVIPSGADTARPSGYCYIALFGNDATGNGSRQFPYRTILAALTALGSQTYILGGGVYRDNCNGLPSAYNVTMVGDGDVTWDYSYFLLGVNAGIIGDCTPTLYNMKLVGNGVMDSSTFADRHSLLATDCYFFGTTIVARSSCALTNCLVVNCASSQSTARINAVSCTFFQCINLLINSSPEVNNCIFYQCNLQITAGNPAIPRYSLIYHCNFNFGAYQNPSNTLYPGVPAGFTYYSTIPAMQAAMTAAFPSVTISFVGCAVGDPLFNNISIYDLTLSFNSPAKNLSYFGTFVGARSIAFTIKARAIEANGDFDFSTNTNLQIADNSITLVDTSQNAQIDTNCITNTIQRALSRIPLYGTLADRNGQYIDSIADLDTVVKMPSDQLVVPASYLVEAGAITYNGAIYQPGDRFTTRTGFTSFTTSASGVVREILEAPERHTVMMRVGNGGSPVAAGDLLTAGYWYYVLSGTVTYKSAAYTAGSVFKATDTTAFSGTGSVITALTTEVFQHYEPGLAPTSNNTGDAATGSILRGNGDPAYVRGGLGVTEFPINAKFIQIRFYIKVNNLKP